MNITSIYYFYFSKCHIWNLNVCNHLIVSQKIHVMIFQKNLRSILNLLWISAILISVISSCSTEKYEVKTATDSNGYTYEYVSNDPLDARFYTLDNGLKVYLSYNPDEPRIATLIGVRAGSTSDPIETTGLAHYFEHLMFKGTNKIATLDWEKEKVYLDQITELFESTKLQKIRMKN